MAYQGCGDDGEDQEVFRLGLGAAAQAQMPGEVDSIAGGTVRMPREASHVINIGFAA